MIKHRFSWNEKITVFRRIKRDKSGSYRHGSRGFVFPYPTRPDFGNPVCEFTPDEFPIFEWSSVEDFKRFVETTMPNTSGIYYFFARDKILQTRKKKKQRRKAGRPEYSRDKLINLKIFNRPRQRTMAGTWNCLAKIEMDSGECTKIWEHKTRRKRPPYHKPRYPVIRQIEKNASR